MNENQTINIYVDYRLAIQLFGQKCEIARSSQERSVVVLIINHQSPGDYEGWMSYHAQFLNFRPDF